MTRLLHISASPRGAPSESLQVAEHFLDAVRDARPDVEIDTYDRWDGTLPPFGPAAADAKMGVFAGQVPTGGQAAAWQAAKDTSERFAAADEYLFTVPMWNHGILVRLGRDDGFRPGCRRPPRGSGTCSTD